MARTTSSKRWLDEHFADEYVQRAQREGYRSRAVYKLLELDEKYKLIQPATTVVDLGAAPGSWSEVVASKLGSKGRLIASDILDMEPLEGVTFIKGDFREQEVLDEILKALGPAKADLVISDMAPNLSGNGAVDQPRTMLLVDLALEMAQITLKKEGCLLVKVFQGEGFDSFMKSLRENFKSVSTKKPAASRSRSREVYVLARGFKG